MDNDQLLEEMLEQAQEDGIIYDDATYALEIEYTTQSWTWPYQRLIAYSKL